MSCRRAHSAYDERKVWQRTASKRRWQSASSSVWKECSSGLSQSTALASRWCSQCRWLVVEELFAARRHRPHTESHSTKSVVQFDQDRCLGCSDLPTKFSSFSSPGGGMQPERRQQRRKSNKTFQFGGRLKREEQCVLPKPLFSGKSRFAGSACSKVFIVLVGCCGKRTSC